MNNPSLFNPQISALQNQMSQLQNIYNQITNQQTQAPMLQNHQLSSQLSFVDGFNGAKAYLKNMPPNSSAAVFDKTDSIFYILSVDANGTAAAIKRGKFTLEDVDTSQENIVTKQDFELFKQEIRSLFKEITLQDQPKSKNGPVDYGDLLAAK